MFFLPIAIGCCYEWNSGTIVKTSENRSYQGKESVVVIIATITK